jgi:hypothetical protein
MTVLFEAAYALPGGDEPLINARIAHANNWLSDGDVTASTTATGYFSAAPITTLTYERWKPTAATGTWEYEHTGASECDYACIAAHTLGTNGSTINAQYWDGAAWQDLCAATAIADDSPIMIIFEPITATRWRINISAGTTAPEIGCIKFGAALQMPQAIYGGHRPVTLARQTILRSNYSETGEFLGRTRQRTYLETSYNWTHLTAAWIRTNWPDFQKAIELDAFWIAWRPGDYDEVGFAHVDEVPIPSNMGLKDYMQVDMSVRARGYD